MSYGLYVPSDGARDGATVVSAWQLVLPQSGCFTHLTAVALYGWWLPPVPVDLPLFATVDHAGTRPRREGLFVIRRTGSQPVRTLESGVRVAEPGEVLLACARHLRLLDLVAICDSALHAGSCTVDELMHAAKGRRPGAPLLREVLRHVDTRAESGWESMLRMVHVLCGVSVEPQYVVRDEAGDFVARGDLWLRHTRSLHEYDGGEHRKPARQRRDLARDRRLVAAGWVRRGYTSADVIGNGLMILRDADNAVGREHLPARIRLWHRHLAESLVTPSGMAAFGRRLAHRTGRG